MRLGKAHDGREVLELPSEAAYHITDLIAKPIPPGRWLGPPAVVVGTSPFPAPHPSLDATVGTARTAPGLGYAPTMIRLLAPPPDESVPIVCRVWVPSTGLASTRDDPQAIAQQWQSDPTGVHPDILNWVVGREFPQLVDFPQAHSDIAAIGSLFWNRKHPKIKPIVEALLSLATARRRGELPAHLTERLDHYRDPSGFVGWIVATRIDSRVMAIDRIVELLAIATAAGLISEDKDLALHPADFFPGTLDRHRSPHRYDFANWRREGVTFDAPLP